MGKVVKMFIFNYANIIDPLLRDVRTFTVKFTEAKKGDKILDICCGTGNQLFYFAKLGVETVGIDINPKMIKIAEKRKYKLGVKNVSFLVGDAAKLPFEENSFDLALISLALHEIDENLRDKIISEMKQVVKENGSLIFIDLNSPLPKNPQSLFIKIVEYLMGKSRFKSYLENGGLPALLEKNKLKLEKRDYLMSGLIEIIKVKNNQNSP